jgi:hypothetical protein
MTVATFIEKWNIEAKNVQEFKADLLDLIESMTSIPSKSEGQQNGPVKRQAKYFTSSKAMDKYFATLDEYEGIKIVGSGRGGKIGMRDITRGVKEFKTLCKVCGSKDAIESERHGVLCDKHFEEAREAENRKFLNGGSTGTVEVTDDAYASDVGTVFDETEVPVEDLIEVPEELPEKVSKKKPEKASEKKSEKVQEKKPEKASEKKSEKVQEKKSEKASEKKSEKVQEKKSEKASEKKSEKVQEKKPEEDVAEESGEEEAVFDFSDMESVSESE